MVILRLDMHRDEQSENYIVKWSEGLGEHGLLQLLEGI
jgi:hypothetical protein